MGDPATVRMEWVCSEGAAQGFSRRVRGDGGEVAGTKPFVPDAKEADLYSDAQFDPLVAVTIVLTAGMILRYARELVLDLKGREVAVFDLSGDTPQFRVVPVGKATQVIVKAPGGKVSQFVPSDIDKIEKNLASMLPGAKAGGPAADPG